MTIVLLALAAGAADPTVTVLAASSLTESLQQAADAWTAQGHPHVALSFGGSSKLARQIEAGAAADLYFSADAEWMDWLATRSLIDPSTRVDLLGNHLVVVVPAAGTLAFSSASDLAKPELKHLALAGEAVPAGRYARVSLASIGTWDAVKDRVVSADDVRIALGWVAAGEAEAGVVYATDARVEPRVKVAFTLPDASHPPIVYPAAVLAGAPHASDAASFLAFCRSPEGAALFAAAGFTPPPTPK